MAAVSSADKIVVEQELTELTSGQRSEDDAGAAKARSLKMEGRTRLEDEEADQALDSTLDRGGKFLRKIGMSEFFRRPVVQPKKGEELKNITLQVPFTKTFVAEQVKLGLPRRKTNMVRTSKYNVWSFVPLAAAYQFRRYTNMFYLLIAVIALVGYNVPNLWVVSYNPITIIILLAVVLGVALIFEGKDDLNRHRGDRQTNNAKVERLRNSKIEECTWGELLPGDFVIVYDRQIIPADLVVLATYGADRKGATCYIETSSIDGETNLKIKDIPQFMVQNQMENNTMKRNLSSYNRASGRKLESGESSMTQFANAHKDALASFIPRLCAGTYEYEQPNVFLQFNAAFTPRGGGEKQPLDFKNFLLRGSELRNTKFIFGLVVYAGEETKLALSQKAVPAKLGRIDVFMNRILIGVTVLFFALVAVADILIFTVAPNTDTWWYFKFTSSTSSKVPGGLAFFFTYMVLFANIIPIPIIIVVEVLNFYAGYMLRNDLEIYHEETDTVAVCRTNNLVCEVGQITHIFSDKTGTLTRNQMKMIGCFVNGRMYGHIPSEVNAVDEDDGGGLTPKPSRNDSSPNEEGAFSSNFSGRDPDQVELTDDHSEGSESMKSIQLEDAFKEVTEILHSEEMTDEKKALLDFFILLAVCHTVVLDFDEDGNVTLNSESPDEEAFVAAASVVGIVLESTADGTISIRTPDASYEYRIMALNPFNSTRKRMSLVLTRSFDNSIVLMMKGADNVMFDRVAPGQEEYVATMTNALNQYAWGGLRTLVMGQKELSCDEFIVWEKQYKDALVAPSTQRGALLAAAAQEIESNVTIIGASAIEDQLQLGVPDSIQTLRDAGIQVWVLTGDKIETAINIGLASNLLDSNMLQLKLVSTDVEHLETQMDGIIAILETAMEEIRRSPAAEEFNDFKQVEEDLENQHGTGDMTPQCCYSLHKYVHKRMLASISNESVQANVALIVSGVSLELLLQAQKGNPELEHKLLTVARTCKVVLACRVSPAQKSLIVEMVRYAKDADELERPPITLAIGDGANDVPMIQSAHVGVGISGHEGRQAVNSSDFAIAQFRFLVRLMLIHGRWNYRRQANVIVYVVYSWQLYTYLLFIYLPYSLYSGTQIYIFDIYVATFAYFANVCICTHGWFDKDLSAESVLRNPWTYAIGVKSKDLNFRKLVTLVVRAFAHTLLIWGFVMMIANITIGIDTLGTAVFVALVGVLYVRQAIMGTTLTAITFVVFGLDIILFLIVMAIAQSPPLIYSREFGGAIWTGVFLAMCSVFLIEMFVRYMKKEFFPRPLDLLIEQDRGYYKGEKHARHAHEDAFKVIEEVGKLTVLPFHLGARRIKQTIEKQRGKEEEQAASSETSGEDERPKPRTGSSVFSSTVQRLRPGFDYDFASKLKLPSLSGKKEKQLTSSGGTDVSEEVDNENLAQSASRLDFHEYVREPNTHHETLHNIAEGEEDDDYEGDIKS
uniref:Phospholipid-transporting ATPase n=1 Tax=Mucochytrium quahogii TaxID=96639 RepID=A0A7S2W787_9STRA|mmetsp:Transcript_43958/g.70345  ORF Transcript_43958/g.70345 Transcript_43958/m.70345 type:complete len:1460 (-) Transcript_43958:2557-6936(-)|eukprot:CAMPEP_0203757372 /NCGR_PEP_ID=MMETSP0098-20131031/10467_1 /ASSEMBLY_ACC=CAM_ASM_000208 /TAXON_ID=96639 /ORGANISM=" , Strain NY0313808BC1" /LENGTH=1459 /DNA_ID=CAMNT_0050649581 /DNA_START=435 /DNA_END=4814 /DNA_ORIENTATION=+